MFLKLILHKANQWFALVVGGHAGKMPESRKMLTLCWAAALSARLFGENGPHHLCYVLFGSKAIMGADFANSRQLSSVASSDLPVRILDNSRTAIGWRLA